MKLTDLFKRSPASADDTVTVRAGGETFTSADYDALRQAFGIFTGSTIPGTMSMPQTWKLDYYALRERSWQAYTENELAAAFLDRLRHFVVNTGLKYQYEPSLVITEHLGINISDDDRMWIERDFALYASSCAASLDGRRDLHTLADEAYLNMLAAGDMLVILHIINGELKVQHIDGKNVVDPWDRQVLLQALRKGHTITNGIEYDKRGREVAYYVRQPEHFKDGLMSRTNLQDSVERIPAKGRTGRLIAFRPCRNNQRIGGGRGKPLLTPVLQNLEVTRRYKLAELLAAEVNAQIVWAIEHDELSSGLNPLQSMPSGGGRHTTGQAQEFGTYSNSTGDQIAGKITQMTAGTAINLGRGQKLKATDTKRPNVSGAAFLEAMNVDTAAAVNIPYEISRMMFTSNYSASRAALEMFKIIINFERKGLVDGYYGPIVRERQRLRALQGKIPAPAEYKNAIITRDEVTMSGFEQCRFTGVIVPHVDPVKEVKASIERINSNLSTRERETEALGTGDFDTNIQRLEKEKKALDKKGLNEEGANLSKTEEERKSLNKSEGEGDATTKDKK